MVEIKRLAEIIESLLNRNEQGLIFKTFFYDKKLDRRYEDDGVEFIASIISPPTGSLIPVYGLQSADSTFNLQILYPVDKKNELHSAMEKFYLQIVGLMMIENGNKIVFSCDRYNISSIQSTVINELSENDPRLALNVQREYMVVEVPIYFFETKRGFLGNEIEYWIKREEDNEFIKLLPVNSAAVNSRDTKSAQGINANTTFVRNTSNAIAIGFDAFYTGTDLEKEILVNTLNGLSMNRIYHLMVKMNDEELANYEVVLQNDTSVSIAVGDMIKIRYSFARAMILEE